MFGVIYSAATGRIRVIIRPDRDADLDSIAPRKGEAFMRCEEKEYGDLFALQAMVSTKTGLVPKDDRYVIVDPKTGDVMGSIVADPLTDDAVDGHDLIAHATADIGWKLDAQTKELVDLRPPEVSGVKPIADPDPIIIDPVELPTEVLGNGEKP